MLNTIDVSAHEQAFLTKIEDRSAAIAVIGLGYVGLPLLLGFHKLGFKVIGFDTDQAKIDALAKGHSYIGHIPTSDVQALGVGERYVAGTDPSILGAADAILICVPTPLTSHREPDLTFVRDTARTIAPHLQPGQLVVLESTTYPGTTREELLPLLAEGSGLKSQEDIFIAFSPEREDPGNPVFSTTKIPKVVGAEGAAALNMAGTLYEALVPQVVRVSSCDTAEAVKLTENIFRAVNIALVNELKMIYGAMGVDVWEVIEAAKTKPFGFMAFYPGPGLGGHCIPIDPFYLTWKAREYDYSTKFIELAGEINRNMPAVVVSNLAAALSRKSRKALNGSRILLIGAAYKKNVEDIRESPSFVLIRLLEEAGASVDYYDPHVPELPRTREHPEYGGRRSVAWTPETIAAYDAALISTDHDAIDWSILVENSPLVVDTRNALQAFNGTHADRIVKS
jgi:UDP-N-acetyl-D-glucosamine dehydrogenase